MPKGEGWVGQWTEYPCGCWFRDMRDGGVSRSECGSCVHELEKQLAELTEKTDRLEREVEASELERMTSVQ